MRESGIILLNKPTGMSSNAAVGKVKKLVLASKAGHLGTLDPMGAGVLPITIGKATRLFDYFLKKRKQYRAVFKFGIETDTFDSEGKITKIEKCVVDEKKLQSVVNSMIGVQEQMPPNFSAKKINGKKAYELARQGKEVELKPKKIEIYDFKIVKKLNENEYLFEIDCSEGTYIRSLCRDVASQISTCGVMCAICRTICGDMHLHNTTILEQIELHKTELVLNVDDILDIESFIIDENEMRNLLSGKMIKTTNLIVINQNYKIEYDNQVVGIGHFDERNILTMDCFLFEGVFDGRKY